MINETYAKKYCKDYKNIENYGEAISDEKMWECHHRLELLDENGNQRERDLSYKDLKSLDLYYNRPAEELIFLTRSEHLKLHHQTEDYRKKISEARKGKYSGESNPMYGKVPWNKGKCLSEEVKKKMSDAKKGKEGTNKGKNWKNINGKRVWY